MGYHLPTRSTACVSINFHEFWQLQADSEGLIFHVASNSRNEEGNSGSDGGGEGIVRVIERVHITL